MTKQTFLEKTIEKKKDKRRPENEKEKVITVIGRSGNRFIKRDVAVKKEETEKANGVKIEDPKV